MTVIDPAIRREVELRHRFMMLKLSVDRMINLVSRWDESPLTDISKDPHNVREYFRALKAELKVFNET